MNTHVCPAIFDIETFNYSVRLGKGHFAAFQTVKTAVNSGKSEKLKFIAMVHRCHFFEAVTKHAEIGSTKRPITISTPGLQ